MADEHIFFFVVPGLNRPEERSERGEQDGGAAPHAG